MAPALKLFLIVLLGCVVAGGALLVWRGARKRAGGFLDYVKNPNHNTIGEMVAEVDREAKAAEQWSEAKIRESVRHFAFKVSTSRDAWDEQRILRSLGTRTHSAILQILADPSSRGILTVPTGTNLLPETPLDRLCNLLESDPPTESVGLLKPFLDDPSKEIRKSVIMVIAASGALDAIDPIRRALEDSDEYVRAYALMGLDRGIRAGRIPTEYRSALQPDLKALISAAKNTDNAAPLLIDLDRKEAVTFLLSTDLLTPSFRDLHRIFSAFLARDISVPRERLLTLIAELETLPVQYPNDYALGGALTLLGYHRNVEDRPLLEAKLTHASEEIASGASAGLLASYDLQLFADKIAQQEESLGFNKLSPGQKYYSAVIILDAEVNNGGYLQYFVNSSGDHWKDALAGLEAMGFVERTAILKEALAKFGSNGPSGDRDVRGEQQAKLARKDEEVFREQDSRWYKCKENVDVFVTRYVIKHSDAFR